MNWAVLYMLRYPKVLARVRQELDDVVGRDRLPTLADLSKLPCIEATLLEVFRRACIVPWVLLIVLQVLKNTVNLTNSDCMLRNVALRKNYFDTTKLL